MISYKFICHLLFHLKGTCYSLLYHKACLGILISHIEPQKMAKNVKFWKMENYCFWLKLEHFQEKCDPKPCIMMYLGYIHLIHMVPVTFGKKNSNHEKMAHFGLNWEESKWPGHFSSTFLNFLPEKPVLNYIPKKSSLTSARARAGQWVKLPFLSKKWILRAENGILTPCPVQPSADVKELFFGR